MKIAGFIKTSLIDYPGNIAAVIFTQGCNFRCGFCHNPELLDINSTDNLINEEEVWKYLRDRKKILDGVVITGGEPTLQPDLYDFIQRLKELGYLVKLDSNGTNPKLIKRLVKEGLVDYIAMDIKGKLDDYQKICGPVNIENIKESIEYLKGIELPTEFRTTVLPFYHQVSDFETLGQMLSGSKIFTIQGFRPQITFDQNLTKEKPFTIVELEQIKTIMKKYVVNVNIYANL